MGHDPVTPGSPGTNEELLLRARRDPEAFGALFDRTATAVERWFRSRVHDDPGVAAELTAETFAQALRSVHRFRPNGEGSADAWLYGIARNLLRRYLRTSRVASRARRKLEVVTTHPPDDEVVILERLDAARNSRRLAELMATLPPAQRDAIRLRVIDELPFADVARALDCSIDTARARVSRGLRHLRHELKDR